MGRLSICLLAGLASWLSLAILKGQPTSSGPSVIRALHPVSEAADLLRKTYGTVVTYEDPIWEWPGEMVTLGKNVSPAAKGGWVPGWLSFTLPAIVGSAPELASRLDQVLAAFHQQTSGPRFRVVTSKLGLHIVPLEVRDRDGRLMPAQNPFDRPVFIPQQQRTAHEHLVAIGAAIAAGNDDLRLGIVPQVVDLRGDSFNFMFAATRAEERPFIWGTANMSARDALIDLLDRSATTFYWDMKCRGTLSAKYDVCTVHLAPLEIDAGSGGASVSRVGQIHTLTNGKKLLVYDRCGGCEGGRALTHAEQNSEKSKR